VGVLLNVSLDHKSMDELRVLFRDYLRASRVRAVNADNAEALALADGLADVVTFAIEQQDADLTVEHGSLADEPTAIAAVIRDRRDGSRHALRLAIPGRHNLSNALAALAGANAAGVPVAEAVHALESFAGIARRFDVLGTSSGGVTVIDDFGHNPEKCAATLRTLKRHPGRVIAFFQPHGYGPLRQMGVELAETFARELGSGDQVLISDPVYYGGTVDRDEGAERIVRLIGEAGAEKGIAAAHIASREAIGDRIAQIAQAGDRVVVMGARDDTLTTFAQALLGRLP
jgi:UDP-N-acetylmuramate--alanine ligase